MSRCGARCSRIERDIAGPVGSAEESVVEIVVGQAADARKLEPVERDVRSREIERGDAGGVGDQIRQDIAAAGRDRDHVVIRRDRQRLEIDVRVFPDLRIDQSLEQARKGKLQQALSGHQRASPNGIIQPPAGGCHRTGGQCNLLQQNRIGPI